jgi:hypothetical protein
VFVDVTVLFSISTKLHNLLQHFSMWRNNH